MQNYKIEIKIPQIDMVVGAEFQSKHDLTDEQAKQLLKSRAAHTLIDKLEELGGYVFITPPQA